MNETIAIVTGGSRGIGAAIAKRLAADGAKIVVNYAKNAEAAAAVAAEIEAAGGTAAAIQADVSEPAQIEALFAQTVKIFGRLDVLINNAAIADFLPLNAVDAAKYDEIFNLNVRGPLLCAKEAARCFGTSGGRIINISSSITQSPSPGASVYAASKAALESLTAFLAVELGPRQITVNAVAPGITETDMMRSMISPEMERDMIARTPLGRIGEPADIADVVAFLASPAARWITGQTIIANGGLR